jgi:hypothetical protein
LDHNKQAPLPDSERQAARPFKFRSNVKLHMYCSEAPCESTDPMLRRYAHKAQVATQAWSSP